jgi:hypothetical protein
VNPARFPFGPHEDRMPTHGYEPTREAAMVVFAKRLARGSPFGNVAAGNRDKDIHSLTPRRKVFDGQSGRGRTFDRLSPCNC